MLLLSSADVFQNELFKKFFLAGILSVSNCLDPDQDRCSIRPDLRSNGISAGNESTEHAKR